MAALLGDATPAVLGPLLRELFMGTTLTLSPAGLFGGAGGPAAVPEVSGLPPIAS